MVARAPRLARRAAAHDARPGAARLAAADAALRTRRGPPSPPPARHPAAAQLHRDGAREDGSGRRVTPAARQQCARDGPAGCAWSEGAQGAQHAWVGPTVLTGHA
eukprot:367656-Prymnesium_polylepis.1